jgi:hypothetical protein
MRERIQTLTPCMITHHFHPWQPYEVRRSSYFEAKKNRRFKPVQQISYVRQNNRSRQLCPESEIKWKKWKERPSTLGASRVRLVMYRQLIQTSIVACPMLKRSPLFDESRMFCGSNSELRHPNQKLECKSYLHPITSFVSSLSEDLTSLVL